MTTIFFEHFVWFFQLNTKDQNWLYWSIKKLHFKSQNHSSPLKDSRSWTILGNDSLEIESYESCAQLVLVAHVRFLWVDENCPKCQHASVHLSLFFNDCCLFEVKFMPYFLSVSYSSVEYCRFCLQECFVRYFLGSALQGFSWGVFWKDFLGECFWRVFSADKIVSWVWQGLGSFWSQFSIRL